MLEPILKGLVEWIYQMMVDIMDYASGELLGVMSMDLSYFETTAPIIKDIVNVFVALGWALLIGNLVFQLVKVMMSGAGFEAEDPKLLFLRTFVFGFLLLASRQICEIGLSITSTVIDLLVLPSSITVTTPDESMFSLGGEGKWLLVIIVGVVLMVQMVKLLFEIGERYVITSVLTFFAPLAFSMGGSRNTNDIFKGWCRMYGSMLVMMVMNIVFLKLIMSAMSRMTSGGVLIWLVFVVALTRVARKIDSHIGKIGLNPAQTGSGIGSRIPGMMTMMAVRVMSSTISRSLAGAKGSSGRNGSSAQSRRGAGGGTRFGGFRTANSNGGGGRNSSASYGRGNQTAYTTSGGTNVNQGGVNMGGTAQSANVQQGQNTLSPHAPSDSKGAASVHHNTNYTANQGTQNNTDGNAVQKPGSTQQGNTTRPPIPRNPVGTPGGMTHRSESDRTETNRETNGAAVSGNKTTVVGKDGAVPRGKPGNMAQSVSRTSRQNVNSPTSVSESVQKRAQQAGGVYESGTVNGGANAETRLGGAGDRVTIGGSTQRVSGTQLADTGGEHFRESHDRRFSQMQNRTEATEKRVNHEYKNGKYNPAAANRKERQTYYQKELKKEKRRYYQDRQFQRDSLKRKRGEDFGKRKRKK